MTYATGRHMRHTRFSHGYEVEDVVGMVRLVYGDRVTFYRGDADLAPGVSLHHIGGHTPGLQCVRVMTKRGWVVLASDASIITSISRPTAASRPCSISATRSKATRS